MSRCRPRCPCVLVPVAVLALLLAACGGGGGSGASGHVQAPVVLGFSPSPAPLQPTTAPSEPTFTNRSLTTRVDLRYAGRIVIYFQGGTDLDLRTLHVGGDPVLGVSPSSLKIEREVPGVGNVLVPIRVALADAAGTGTQNAIVCQPLPPFARDLGDSDGDGLPEYLTDLPDGQYRVGVFSAVRDIEGHLARNVPMFHSFTVGATDDIAPRVVSSQPAHGEQHVGAGVPPPPPPPEVSEAHIADVTTNIFGPNSPDVVIRFTEAVLATSVSLSNVQVVDAGTFVPGGGVSAPIAPAPGYPRLRSAQAESSLPGSSHEIVWRADPATGGFPYGTQVQVTVRGSWTDAASMAASPGRPDHPLPIQDLSRNPLQLDHVLRFQTIAPPELPQNPFPEYAVWWSASSHVGVLDTINQQGLAQQLLGTATFPLGVPQNVLPDHTDQIATSAHIPNFDPDEINFDGRTNPSTCHTWIYVQSQGSAQVAILDSRSGIPVALIDTPSPGGLAVQVGAGSADALLVTNAGANTFTAYDIGLLTPGTRFLNAPLFVKKVQPTGNNPRAIAVTAWGGGISGWNRGGATSGPSVPLIMFANFGDGTVSTIRMGDTAPVRQFALGPTAAPNDIAFSPCLSGASPILYAAISQGGLPGQGKVAYYVAGPGCQTGSQTAARPDTIVGEVGGLEGPDGLDENVTAGTPVYFTVAESGANAVTTLGIQGTLPRILNRFTNVGANPTKVAHRASWVQPCLAPAGSGGCGHPGTPSCWYAGTEQDIVTPFPQTVDASMVPARDLYVCARGSSQITVLDLTSGSRHAYSPIAIAGVRFVAGPGTQ